MRARIYEFDPFRLDADKGYWAFAWTGGAEKEPRFDRLVARVHGRG